MAHAGVMGQGGAGGGDALRQRGVGLQGVELDLDGQKTSAVLKDSQHHPVRGETTHVDFLREDLSKPNEAIDTIELVGADDAPGIRDGGVLDQSLREVTVTALPNEIPETLTLDVSELNIGDTLPLSAVVIPSGVTLVDDPETVAASLLAPRLRTDEEEGIEEETELVGESAEASSDAGDSED